ncbi:hypothetical protein [Anabaena sp. UHCC 0399]|uniref:hypothetical protein n=1 Tax=Anabaena sp. UHCC 0399 TaxID=3110238 RepID=UPI002B2042FA|nr:hypothetical protein [Anabaena sp. UHCC 0399]MEA5569178.1 hypothetical protein [Anabaena sp. UHCC 0399]
MPNDWYGTSGSDYKVGRDPENFGFISINDGRDIFYGYGGNDTLFGRNGDDSLYGGDGDDSLTDFSFTEGDKIRLARSTFTALRSVAGTGFSLVSEFARVNSDAAAELSSAFIVYNTTNGKLFYNPNGSASGFASTLDAGGHFATLTGNPSLIACDFSLYALEN